VTLPTAAVSGEGAVLPAQKNFGFLTRKWCIVDSWRIPVHYIEAAGLGSTVPLSRDFLKNPKCEILHSGTLTFWPQQVAGEFDVQDCRLYRSTAPAPKMLGAVADTAPPVSTPLYSRQTHAPKQNDLRPPPFQ